MAQKITVKIAGKEFSVESKSPDYEEIIRIAANSVNRRVSDYMEKFPGKNFNDIMAFVVLNESIDRVRLKKELEQIKKESETLNTDIENYLNNINNVR